MLEMVEFHYEVFDGWGDNSFERGSVSTPFVMPPGSVIILAGHRYVLDHYEVKAGGHMATMVLNPEASVRGEQDC